MLERSSDVTHNNFIFQKKLKTCFNVVKYKFVEKIMF